MADGGLGFTDADAASIYGTYTGSAWGAAILGGMIADRLLGQYRSVLFGGIIIMLGHFTLAFPALPFFYAGLASIVVGTGLLKPNVSTLVGSLYPQGDHRRDAGFSIFYMGINLGAFLGPLVAGYLAQRVDWHSGSHAAGVGMALGVTQYVLGKAASAAGHRAAGGSSRRDRQPPGHRRRRPPAARRRSGFTPGRMEAHRARSSCSSSFAILFWGGYEQAGSTLNLFADRNTRLELFGFSFPSSWFQSVQPIFVILLAPVFAWLWIGSARASRRARPSSRSACLFMGLSFLVLVPAGRRWRQTATAARQPVVAGCVRTRISEFGELCLSPVGLSAVTKLAPPRIVGLMMGVWFLSMSFGNKLAGWAAGFIETMPLETLFGVVTRRCIVGGRRHVRARQADAAAHAAEPESVTDDVMALEKYQAEAQLHEHARASRRPGRRVAEPARSRAVLLRAEAPGQPPPLRLPPRAQRRAALVGRAERARRSIRRSSGWRCTSRITRSSTASSKASSPRATAPASSCCGTTARGRRRPTTWTRRSRRAI